MLPALPRAQVPDILKEFKIPLEGPWKVYKAGAATSGELMWNVGCVVIDVIKRDPGRMCHDSFSGART